MVNLENISQLKGVHTTALMLQCPLTIQIIAEDVSVLVLLEID